MTNLPDPGLTPPPSRAAADAWHWQLEDAQGAVVEGPAGGAFPSQGDAETWLGESWRELRESGVSAVRLFEGDREVYGPMALDA
ncbi:hypothetical protein [Nocardioides massiliensis]|uniref:Uncharacterized protein n=1 Tax=Nocardioides massiliensis TaxID=1325935 RepID=A0ABT9NTV0_9ACTN|nr:hypothetical protein [Nocardioides massiliensis]MDP9823604.1 hypothetical protein [Nocardioides massiliensis]